MAHQVLSQDQTNPTKLEWSASELDQLLACHSAIEFLKLSLKLKSNELNISELGRRCGYKSRSYLRDVIAAKKNMTLPLADKIAEALQLDATTAHYFLRLCANDYDNCRLNTFIPQRKEQHQSQHFTRTEKSFDLGFENYFFPVVFAAIGSPTKGASIGTIQKRTDLEIDTITTILKKLEALDLVICKGRLYYPQLNHAQGKGLGSKSFFKNYFLRCLEETHRSARHKMDSQEDLFFASHLLVRKEKIPELKKALREVLFQFVDDHNVEDGEQVKNLICSFN